MLSSSSVSLTVIVVSRVASTGPTVPGRRDGTARYPLTRAGDRAPARERQLPPQRDRRPHRLQQQEAPLLVREREHREQQRAGEVGQQVDGGGGAHAPELEGRERHEDQHGAESLRMSAMASDRSGSRLAPGAPPQPATPLPRGTITTGQAASRSRWLEIEPSRTRRNGP